MTEKKKIGICDTMFAKADMGKLALETIADDKRASEIETIRVTVPGFKDLPVAAKKLIEEQGCEIVLAFGMAGKANVDDMCAHEASTGLINAQLMTNKHILGVFVFENEGKTKEELKSIIKNRTIKHTINAMDMVFNPEKLIEKAGTAERQGKENEEFFKF